MTLEPDVEALLRKVMRERDITFKEALNQALREGLSRKGGVSKPYRLPTFRMGFRPEQALDKALALAAAMEDEEIARKLSLRK